MKGEYLGQRERERDTNTHTAGHANKHVSDLERTNLHSSKEEVP